MKNISYYVFCGVLFFILFIYGITEVNYSSVLKNKIAEDYEAIVLEKFNPKQWSPIATQLKIQEKNGKILELPIRSEIINYISEGDSIIKIKNENLCYVRKLNGEIEFFYYVRISLKTRNHWTFPKEWKDKWMESSSWDTLSFRK